MEEYSPKWWWSKKKKNAEFLRIQKINVQEELAAIKGKFRAGNIPIIEDSPLILKKDEKCLYITPATRIIRAQRVVGHTGGGVGISVRVAKGMYAHTGGGGGVPIRGMVSDNYDGCLFITTKRIVFEADAHGFTVTYPTITSMEYFTDGCKIYKTSTAYIIASIKAPILQLYISNILRQYHNS